MQKCYNTKMAEYKNLSNANLTDFEVTTFYTPNFFLSPLRKNPLLVDAYVR